jgi:uncharacterized phosphatase
VTVLALVRHGRTSWNLERRLQGRTDRPLDDIGRRQAEAAARTLASRPWASVLCSPLSRAQETAALIAAELGTPAPVSDVRLLERDYGVAEGITVAEAHERWPDGHYPGAESPASLAARSGRALQCLAALPEPTIVVGHGAFLRAGIEALTGRSFPRILNGDVVLVEHDSAGACVFHLIPR